jgi:hypothetical protein
MDHSRRRRKPNPRRGTARRRVAPAPTRAGRTPGAGGSPAGAAGGGGPGPAASGRQHEARQHVRKIGRGRPAVPSSWDVPWFDARRSPATGKRSPVALASPTTCRVPGPRRPARRAGAGANVAAGLGWGQRRVGTRLPCRPRSAYKPGSEPDAHAHRPAPRRRAAVSVEPRPAARAGDQRAAPRWIAPASGTDSGPAPPGVVHASTNHRPSPARTTRATHTADLLSPGRCRD